MTACPCLFEPLHRRAVSPSVDVVWTDTEGCTCGPEAVELDDRLADAAHVRQVASELTKAAEVLAAIEATEPGSPERAALHVGCLNHRCAGVAS